MPGSAESFEMRLDAVHRQLGRRRESVTIVGVTKFQPLEKVREAIDLGIRDLACNYVQEGEHLQSLLKGFGSLLRWHFIGHIQSNKVKFLSPYECVQSVDRIKVARALDRLLGESGRKKRVLVEINIGSESSKSGISIEQAPSFLEEISKLEHLVLTGLMCLPPPLEPFERRRPYFAKSRELFDSLRPKFNLLTLSMGTSDDFDVAVEEGSNMIRLGTRLFGLRSTESPEESQ